MCKSVFCFVAILKFNKMFMYKNIFSKELKSLICGFFTVQRETSPSSPLHRRGEQGAGIPLCFVCLFV